ncbi:MAG: hypothetical protein AAFU80_19015 [Pseudomonadota bacterium]
MACLGVGWLGLTVIQGGLNPNLTTSLVASISNPGAQRVVFVGRAFDANQGVLSIFDRMGVKGLDAFPPPLQANFIDGDVDEDYVARTLRRYRPDVVVLQAFPSPDQGLGWQLTMAETMGRVAALVRAAGTADIVIVAHPPAKPSGSVGFLAATRKIEAVAQTVAADVGAQVARAGAFYAELPHEERMALYSSRGWVFTQAGELAIALSVAAVLGASPDQPLGPAVAREPEPGFFDGWADRARRLAVGPA